MSAYFDALTAAMTVLAADQRTLFLGQSVACGGQRAHATFAGVPQDRRIEMPICEDFTIGFATGLALEGFVPVVFIPRWDFLIIAANQIVNHLDKVAQMNGFSAKVIIRTAVGASAPLDPGPQHTQEHSDAFQMMLRRIMVLKIDGPNGVLPAYRWAMESKSPSIVVERMALY